MISSILQKIKDYKLIEIHRLVETVGFKNLERMSELAPSPRGFLEALQKKNLPQVNIIAEIKKASPSRGIISYDFDPAKIAKTYQKSGASCISVLTDHPSFKGTKKDLEIAREATDIPILRKDFIFDEIQVFESRAIGADCILIIMAAVSDESARSLEMCAHRLGMDVILEVHNREELERALNLESKLLGINNRDLNTFKTDINTTKELKQYIPEEFHVISESGLFKRIDLDEICHFGINSFLIGEFLMKSKNINNEFLKLLNN